MLSMRMSHNAPERCADYKTVTRATEKDYPHAINTHGWVEMIWLEKEHW